MSNAYNIPNFDYSNIVVLGGSGSGKTHDNDQIAKTYNLDILDIDELVNAKTNQLFNESGFETKEKFKVDYVQNHQTKENTDPYTNMKLSMIEELIETHNPFTTLIDMPGDKTTGVHSQILHKLKEKNIFIVYKDVSNSIILDRVEKFLKTASLAEVKLRKGSLTTPFKENNFNECFNILLDQVNTYRSLIETHQNLIDLYIPTNIGNTLEGLGIINNIRQGR